MRAKNCLWVIGYVLLAGCGGASDVPVGLLNHSHHTDAQLWAIWQTAQPNLSQQVDLNPLRRVFQSVPPDVRPGDQRVWSVSPHQLAVAPQTDVSSAEFYAVTGYLRSDPTGLIACPQPCNVHYTAAYSLFREPVTRYAASWEPSESNFEYLLTYEFENQILNELGYDMRWR
jgi:hypothetical protein